MYWQWPELHLLWDLHPAVQWLNFKLMLRFGRRELKPTELRFACTTIEASLRDAT